MQDPSADLADPRNTDDRDAVATLPSDRPVLLRLRSRNQWASGRHSRSLTQPFRVRRREHGHVRSFVFETDHPEALGGQGNGPTPAEFVLYGLAGSLAASLASVAEEQGIRLRAVTSVIEGELDLRGWSGTAPDAPPGYQRIQVELTVDADAPRAVVAHLVARARARATVLDTLTRAVPVVIGLHRSDPEDADVR